MWANAVAPLHVFRFVYRGEAVGVVCACGWVSEIVGSKTTAERLAEEHAEAMDPWGE